MWQAKFKSGPIIDEIEMRNGKEVEQSFNIVVQNLDDLETLSVIQDGKIYTVRMSDGRFTCDIGGAKQNFFAVNFKTVLSGKLKNIRPIYFVRETVVLSEGSNSQGSKPKIDLIGLGFQANIDDTNIKRYLAILPDGTYCIEDR